MSNLVKEFEAKFQDFAEINNLIQFFKLFYEIAQSAEWTDMAVKLFSLEKSLLQIEVIASQKNVSFQCEKLHPLKNFEET